MESRSKHGSGSCLLYFSCLFFITYSVSASSIPSFLRGVHPLDFGNFQSESIKCKDGSKSFSRDRVNDDFCDCIDGTDEPGTSACPRGKFYCRNLGSTPLFLFSSRVNDHICDCCDGSDEYDGTVNCPNTCVMGGGIVYEAEYDAISHKPIQIKENKRSRKLDLIQNLKDLKILLVIQFTVVLYLLISWILYHRLKSRKRRNH